MTVLLHADTEKKDLTRQIDELVQTGGGERPTGFDTANTPLGMLPVPADGYLFGTQNRGPFALGDVADGYVWLDRRSNLTGVRFIRGFITPQNIARIELHWRHDHPRDRPYSKEEMEDAAADNWQHLQEAFK